MRNIQKSMHEIHIVQLGVNLLHLINLRCILFVKPGVVVELICFNVYGVVMCNSSGNLQKWQFPLILFHFTCAT